jgi:putative transcriptional regulator
MPTLDDPNFSRTVTLICEHTPDGAMGIVINRATDLHLRDVLAQMEIPTTESRHLDMPVHVGGPVQTNRGFLIHEPLGNWDSTLHVTESLGVTASRDVLEALARNEGPDLCLLALGYAGWGAGQLENEIGANSWLHVAADRRILFDLPIDQRWNEAVRKLGVDLGSLSNQAGHA